MFKQVIKDLQHVRIGTKFELKYPYEEGHRIVKVESPCDCSVPVDQPEDHRVIIYFTPKEVPKHFKLEGKKSYTFHKKFPVWYKVDGDDTEKLAILELKGIAYE